MPRATLRVTSLPAASVDPITGTRYVAWTDYRTGRAVVLVARSLDGGRAWSSPRPLAASADDQFMPQLAVSARGALIATYFVRHRTHRTGTIDTYAVWSSDRGATFTPPGRVTSRSWNPALDAPSPDRDETFIGDYQGLAVDGPIAIAFWNDARTGRQVIYAAMFPADSAPPIPTLR